METLHHVPRPGTGLPFRRVDLVDRDLAVVARGPDRSSLVPVEDVRLEGDVLTELRPLVRTLADRSPAEATALIGLDYRLVVSAWDGAERARYLVRIDRVAIRGAFERLVSRAGLGERETECARLIVAGLDEASVAIRLGLAPIDLGGLQRAMLHDLNVPDVETLRRTIGAHPRIPRHVPRTLRPAGERTLKPA